MHVLKMKFAIKALSSCL